MSNTITSQILQVTNIQPNDQLKQSMPPVAQNFTRIVASILQDGKSLIQEREQIRDFLKQNGISIPNQELNTLLTQLENRLTIQFNHSSKNNQMTKKQNCLDNLDQSYKNEANFLLKQIEFIDNDIESLKHMADELKSEYIDPLESELKSIKKTFYNAREIRDTLKSNFVALSTLGMVATDGSGIAYDIYKKMKHYENLMGKLNSKQRKLEKKLNPYLEKYETYQDKIQIHENNKKESLRSLMGSIKNRQKTIEYACQN